MGPVPNEAIRRKALFVATACSAEFAKDGSSEAAGGMRPQPAELVPSTIRASASCRYDLTRVVSRSLTRAVELDGHRAARI